MIDDAPNDTYVVAFFLNPGKFYSYYINRDELKHIITATLAYRTAPIYKNNNPLAVPTLVINKKGNTPTCSAKAPEELVKRVGLSLQKMLMHEYGDAYKNPAWKDPKRQMELQNPLLAKHHPSDALAALKKQLRAYTKGTEPFDRQIRPETESTADWWTAVQKDEDGDVLGVRGMFSLHVMHNNNVGGIYIS